MQNINWKIRLKNKSFWLTIIPALALLVQAVLQVFGVKMEFTETVTNLLTVVNATFVVLAIIGIVNDPTTTGLTDSKNALTYHTPNNSK